MAGPAGGDPLERGRLTLRQHGVAVELVSAHGVFSAAGIDPGTAYLLRWLVGAAVGRRRVLDLGCGYGPLGLWLAAADPAREVLAVDRDAEAVACTAAGAELNGVSGRVVARASLGYDDIGADGPFDLVVSNVPAKVGPAALRHLLLDAYHHLEPGGAVAVVVVQRLAAAAGDLLDGDPAVVVEEHHANRSYACWTYRFDGVPEGSDPTAGFARGVYGRTSATFAAGRTRWQASTSFTVPEFDTLAYATVAAVELLEPAPLPGPVAIVGVGQGHLGMAVRATSGPSTRLRLVDRDLLALRTAAANLAPDGVELRHAAAPAGALAGCAAAVVALPEKEPVSVTAALLAPAVAELAPGSPVVIHGRAADVVRVPNVLARRGLRLVAREARGSRAGGAAFTVTPPP